MKPFDVAARGDGVGERYAGTADDQLSGPTGAGRSLVESRFSRAERNMTAGGFPQSDRALVRWGGCRYLLPGELERSLLKDRFLYEDAQYSSLARRLGQAPALPFLPSRAGTCIGRDVRTALIVAVGPAYVGRRCVFALSANGGSAPVAVCAGAPAPGSVDSPGPDRPAPAFGDGRKRSDSFRFRQIGLPVRWQHRHGVRSASDSPRRCCAGRAGSDGQTATGQGDSGPSSR